MRLGSTFAHQTENDVMCKKVCQLLFILLIFIFFRNSYAITFSEDTANYITDYLSAKIHVENDSSNDITIDSFKIELLEGSVDSEVCFFIKDVNDPQKFKYLYSYLTDENDSVFIMQQYMVGTLPYELNTGKFEMPGNSNWEIQNIRIGVKVLSESVTDKSNESVSDGNGSVESDFVVRFIFYASDASSDDFIVVGDNYSPYNSGVDLHLLKNTAHILLKQQPPFRYVDLSGRRCEINILTNISGSLLLQYQSAGKSKHYNGSKIIRLNDK